MFRAVKKCPAAQPFQREVFDAEIDTERLLVAINGAGMKARRHLVLESIRTGNPQATAS